MVLNRAASNQGPRALALVQSPMLHEQPESPSLVSIEPASWVVPVEVETEVVKPVCCEVASVVVVPVVSLPELTQRFSVGQAWPSEHVPELGHALFMMSVRG